MPVYHPRPASAFLSPATVCVCVCVWVRVCVCVSLCVCVCVRPVCSFYAYVSVAVPCQYPKLAPLAFASLRVCPHPYGWRQPSKTQTRAHEHVGSLVVVAVGVKERR